LVLLAAALLASARVGATTAADIPCDDPDPTVPCVFSGSLTVAPGSTLDFGTRAFSIGPSGILTAGEGNSLTIKAPAVRLQAGALLCTAPASGVGANVTVETTGDILLERSGPTRARIDLSAATTGGQLTLTAGGSVNSAGDLLVKGTPGDAGSISISAVGAATLAGEVHLEAGIDGLGGDLTVSAGGAIAASGPLVDSSGGLKGGSIDLEAGGSLSTSAKLDVSGNGAGSDGGFLVLNANGAITVGGRIAADGSGSPDFGGFGGAARCGPWRRSTPTATAGACSSARRWTPSPARWWRDPSRWAATCTPVGTCSAARWRSRLATSTWQLAPCSRAVAPRHGTSSGPAAR